MRRLPLWCLLLLLAGTPARAQVQVDFRLEKTRYLAGEPIVVLVEVRNTGAGAVGYSTCDADVRLEVAGAARRVRLNIFGCFSGMGELKGSCAISHPPLLQPGQTTTFRYLLENYDLRPGEYQLSASGKAGIAGGRFIRTLPLNVVAASARELQAAWAPFVAAADGPDAVQRRHARAAIVESAPSFLESLIARFAADEQFGTSAIEALGRIASSDSRTHLKNLLRGSPEARRSPILLALARMGHPEDTEFLSGVLRDETMDPTSRRYAALGLGHIGGDRVVERLERVLPAASAELRPSIAMALGNTRSRAAVPVLIGMFGNNPSRNEVCGALRTLTHRAWCDGTADDPAATRRQWLRSWSEDGPTAPIFGPDTCPEDAVTPGVASAPAAIERPAPTGPPRISSVVPAVTIPDSVLAVTGYALGLEDSSSVRVLFRRDTLERVGRISSSGRALSRDANNEFQVHGRARAQRSLSGPVAAHHRCEWSPERSGRRRSRRRD